MERNSERLLTARHPATKWTDEIIVGALVLMLDENRVLDKSELRNVHYNLYARIVSNGGWKRLERFVGVDSDGELLLGDFQVAQ